MSAIQDPIDVEHFRNLVGRRLGLDFDDAKLGQLGEVLARRIAATGEASSSYLGRLESGLGGPREIEALAGELTVAETYFFRNVDQFHSLTQAALPNRILARAGQRRLSIVSAGCASGEEPYSIAIRVRELAELAGWTVAIKGVDLNAAGLERAKRGRYSPWSLREVPVDVQTRYFVRDGQDLVLDPAVRSMATFEQHNLAEDDPELWGPETHDVVFCRNVHHVPHTAGGAGGGAADRPLPGPRRVPLPGPRRDLAGPLAGLSPAAHPRDVLLREARRRRSGAAARARSPSASRRPPALHLPTPGSTTSAGPPIEFSRSSSRSRRARRLHPPRLHVARAIDLLRHERFAEAQELLGTLPPDTARDPDVLLLNAVLLTHGGDLAQAERLSTALLAADELNAGAHYLMALCRENAGDLRGAAERDQIAAYIDPAFAMPRLHLGLLARRAGDRARARLDLEKALLLIEREDASRLLLFGGGFGREALLALCRAELVSCGGSP